MVARKYMSWFFRGKEKRLNINPQWYFSYRQLWGKTFPFCILQELCASTPFRVCLFVAWFLWMSISPPDSSRPFTRPRDINYKEEWMLSSCCSSFLTRVVALIAWESRGLEAVLGTINAGPREAREESWAFVLDPSSLQITDWWASVAPRGSLKKTCPLIQPQSV